MLDKNYSSMSVHDISFINSVKQCQEVIRTICSVKQLNLTSSHKMERNYSLNIHFFLKTVDSLTFGQQVQCQMSMCFHC